MRRLAPALTLTLFLLATAPAAAGTGQVTTWPEVLAHAAEHNTTIVIDFYADWCAPCKVFDRDTAQDVALKERLQAVTLWRLDAESQGKFLAEKFAVQGYPTFVVVNDQQQTIDQWFGYAGPTDFIERLDAADTDPTIYHDRLSRYHNIKNSFDARILARIHETRAEYSQAAEFHRDLIELEPGQADGHRIALFEAVATGEGLGQFRSHKVIAMADEIFAADTTSPENRLLVAAYLGDLFARAEQPERWDPYLKAAVEGSEGVTAPQAAAQRSRLLVEYALRIQQDKPAALQHRRQAMGDNWSQDPGHLNSFAWWCFQQEINLEEAETLARRGAELEQRPAEKANILDTVAEIAHLRGNSQAAVASIEEAIRLDPRNRYLRQQLKRFQKNVASND